METIELFSVDKSIPVPLYYQLKQSIQKMIDDGVLKVGDMLPTENELCEHLTVSRPTVRQALNDLVNEGQLTRQKGKGTFVSTPKIDARFFQKLESFNYEMEQKGLVPSTKVLTFEKVPPSDAINAKLQLPADEPLLYLTRLRYADKDPVVYLETWLPAGRFPGLLEHDFAAGSLYITLEEKYGERVSKAHRDIEAVNATKQEAELLQTDKGKAVCLVKTVAYSDTDVPVEYSVARYRGDRNKFSVELYR